MIEPDEIPDVDRDAPLDLTGDDSVDRWRGVAAEDVDEPRSGLALLLRSRSRRLLRSLDATAHAVAAPRRPPHHVQHRRATRRPPARADRHRPRHPAAAARRQRRPAAARDGGRGDGRDHADRRGDLQRVPHDRRARRPRRHPRPPTPRVRALPGAESRLPRAIHVGTRDLASDLRHRRARRHVEIRHRHRRHVGPHDGRHRSHARRAERTAGDPSTPSSFRCCGCSPGGFATSRSARTGRRETRSRS